jgi:hypothetical protein
MKVTSRVASAQRRRLGKVWRFRPTNPKSGNPKKNVATAMFLAAATGAVVASVKVTAEFSLPEPTCAGLKPHVARAGSFEQEKDTLLGNEPVVGFTTRLKIAGWPAGMDVLCGVIPMVKSKF